MEAARQLILAVAPQGFSISLSNCINYTQNYKKGTLQARRHHDGRGVNANIALHLPPRIGVLINPHWLSANVVDQDASNPHSSVAISKDAKAAIMADIAPVQKPGKTWKKIELPDHTWD